MGGCGIHGFFIFHLCCSCAVDDLQFESSSEVCDLEDAARNGLTVEGDLSTNRAKQLPDDPQAETRALSSTGCATRSASITAQGCFSLCNSRNGIPAAHGTRVRLFTQREKVPCACRDSNPANEAPAPGSGATVADVCTTLGACIAAGVTTCRGPGGDLN